MPTWTRLQWERGRGAVESPDAREIRCRQRRTCHISSSLISHTVAQEEEGWSSESCHIPVYILPVTSLTLAPQCSAFTVCCSGWLFKPVVSPFNCSPSQPHTHKKTTWPRKCYRNHHRSQHCSGWKFK